MSAEATQREGEEGWHGTYDRPKDALELVEQVDVLLLESMLADELGKLGKVTRLLEDLTALLSLGELAVEVRRNGAVKDAVDRNVVDE